MIRAVFVLVSAWLPSCVTSDAIFLGSRRYEATAHDFVLVYDSPQDVVRPYVKVARVRARGPDNASWQALLDELNDLVIDVGGDALVLDPSMPALAFDSECTDQVLSGLAIRFGREPRPRVASTRRWRPPEKPRPLPAEDSIVRRSTRTVSVH